MVGALAALLAAGAVATAGWFAYAWNTELDARRSAESALDRSQARVSSLVVVRDRLNRELTQTKQLASRRSAVLRRANRVLTGVDPVLSGVDELQAINEKMRGARDSFASSSDELVGDLIALANYLIDTDPEWMDYSYTDSLIDDINSEIGTVQYYSGSLSTYDSDYAKAVERFDTRASSFTEALRTLEQQLKAATR